MQLYIYAYTYLHIYLARVAGGGPGAAAQLNPGPWDAAASPSCGQWELTRLLGEVGQAQHPPGAELTLLERLCSTEPGGPVHPSFPPPAITPAAPWMPVSAPAWASLRAASGCAVLGQKKAIQRVSWAGVRATGSAIGCCQCLRLERQHMGIDAVLCNSWVTAVSCLWKLVR